jgi:hypothetical protein
MRYRPGWNYETPDALYQLWPPSKTNFTEWAASWTELRNPPLPAEAYLDDDFDDGWRPDGDFRRGATANEALECFPATDEAQHAKRALVRAAGI